MRINDIIKNTLRIGPLVLLLNTQEAKAQFGWLFDSKERLIKNYIAAVMDKDLEEMKSYMSGIRAKRYFISDYGLELLKSLYKDYRGIESYIPQEGKDYPNVYWLIHKNGTYSRFILVDEGGWKIDDVSGPR